MKTKIQISLFPEYQCEVCLKELKHSGVTCQDCAEIWTKKQNEKCKDTQNKSK